MTRALDGRGVLITRPARQSAPLAQRVAALGANPIVFPAIVILPPLDSAALDAAWSNLASYDLAVFVSANAVEFGLRDAARWPSPLVAAAPGPGTAAALRDAGLERVIEPRERMDSEGLLELDALHDVAGRRVAIFRGDGGRDLLGDTLRARGATVDYIECYRRAKPTSGTRGLVDAWKAHEIDATSITSGEGLANLVEALADAREYLLSTPMFVPHPRVAESAKARGAREIVVTGPGDAGLIAALLEYFSPRSKGFE